VPELAGRRLLAKNDDERACDVVGAVAVLPAWHCARGVLDHSGLIAQSKKVRE